MKKAIAGGLFVLALGTAAYGGSAERPRRPKAGRDVEQTGRWLSLPPVAHGSFGQLSAEHKSRQLPARICGAGVGKRQRERDRLGAR
jgi:hypothetical protein